MDLITNRDVNSVYGYTDLHRVESAVAEIFLSFRQLGFSNVLPTKTDWKLPGDFDANSWPTDFQMMRYLSNVKQIKELFPNQVELPETMKNLTWIGANNIEKVLQIADERIRGIRKTYRYSGEIFAGEE